MTTKFSLKKDWPSLLIVIASFAAGYYFYLHFPDRVAVHWGFKGQPNGWGGKFEGAFLIPIILFAMFIMFKVLPMIDPKRERYESFAHVYEIFRNLILMVMFAIFIASGLYNLGYNISIAHLVTLVIGLMMIVMGNYMGKIKMNWFIGVRTPWALSSEEVWNKTNRFGGWMMIVFGIIVIITPFLPPVLGAALFIIGVIASTVGSFVYSYLVYRAEKNKGKDLQNLP